MHRILLACEDEKLAIGIRNALDENYIVESCGTGKWAMEIFRSFLPDVVLVTNNLPDMDPFAFAREIRFSGEHFGIILLTTANTPMITMQAQAMGINSLLLKPCKPKHLAAHIQTMAMLLQSPDSRNWNLDDEICMLLSDLGFRPGPERYRTTRQVLRARYNGAESMMMKSVYLEVAKQNRSTFNQVEKAVRDAVKAAWEDGDQCVWNLYFRPRKNGEHKPPSNEEFIARIVENLKRRKRYKPPLLKEKIG